MYVYVCVWVNSLIYIHWLCLLSINAYIVLSSYRCYYGFVQLTIAMDSVLNYFNVIYFYIFPFIIYNISYFVTVYLHRYCFILIIDSFYYNDNILHILSLYSLYNAIRYFCGIDGNSPPNQNGCILVQFCFRYTQISGMIYGMSIRIRALDVSRCYFSNE